MQPLNKLLDLTYFLLVSLDKGLSLMKTEMYRIRKSFVGIRFGGKQERFYWSYRDVSFIFAFFESVYDFDQEDCHDITTIRGIIWYNLANSYLIKTIFCKKKKIKKKSLLKI